MEENKSDIEKSLEKLKDSPLFVLSLGSKELFHSNFLYWLINAGVLGTEENGKEITGKELFTNVFNILCKGNIIPSVNLVARREKMKLDLSLWTVKTDNKGKTIYTDKGIEKEDKCLLVIENKMKSVPSVNQIVEYIHKFEEDEVPKFILLTLMEKFPDRDKIEYPTKEMLKEWKIKQLNCKIVTYKDLVAKLKESIRDIQFSNKYFENLISDYCTFVDILSQLGDINKISENSSMMLNLDYDINHGFEKLRILQLVQAIRVGILYYLIRTEFDKDKKYKNIKFNTGYGQNGGAFLEIFFAPGIGRDNETGKEQKKEDNKGYQEPSHRSIGVQIQENRYAHFVCPLDKRNDDDNIDNNCVNDFEGFFFKNNKTFQQKFSEKGFKSNQCKNLTLLSFKGESKKGEYHPRFVYQYAIIPDRADYKFIVDQIVNDINYIINKYKNPDDLKINKENKS